MGSRRRTLLVMSSCLASIVGLAKLQIEIGLLGVLGPNHPIVLELQRSVAVHGRGYSILVTEAADEVLELSSLEEVPGVLSAHRVENSDTGSIVAVELNGLEQTAAVVKSIAKVPSVGSISGIPAEFALAGSDIVTTGTVALICQIMSVTLVVCIAIRRRMEAIATLLPCYVGVGWSACVLGLLGFSWSEISHLGPTIAIAFLVPLALTTSRMVREEVRSWVGRFHAASLVSAGVVFGPCLMSSAQSVRALGVGTLCGCIAGTLALRVLLPFDSTSRFNRNASLPFVRMGGLLAALVGCAILLSGLLSMPGVDERIDRIELLGDRNEVAQWTNQHFREFGYSELSYFRVESRSEDKRSLIVVPAHQTDLSSREKFLSSMKKDLEVVTGTATEIGIYSAYTKMLRMLVDSVRAHVRLSLVLGIICALAICAAVRPALRSIVLLLSSCAPAIVSLAVVLTAAHLAGVESSFGVVGAVYVSGIFALVAGIAGGIIALSQDARLSKGLTETVNLSGASLCAGYLAFFASPWGAVTAGASLAVVGTLGGTVVAAYQSPAWLLSRKRSTVRKWFVAVAAAIVIHLYVSSLPWTRADQELPWVFELVISWSLVWAWAVYAESRSIVQKVLLAAIAAAFVFVCTEALWIAVPVLVVAYLLSLGDEDHSRPAVLLSLCGCFLIAGANLALVEAPRLNGWLLAAGGTTVIFTFQHLRSSGPSSGRIRAAIAGVMGIGCIVAGLSSDMLTEAEGTIVIALLGVCPALLKSEGSGITGSRELGRLGIGLGVCSAAALFCITAVGLNNLEEIVWQVGGLTVVAIMALTEVERRQEHGVREKVRVLRDQVKKRAAFARDHEEVIEIATEASSLVAGATVEVNQLYGSKDCVGSNELIGHSSGLTLCACLPASMDQSAKEGIQAVLQECAEAATRIELFEEHWTGRSTERALTTASVCHDVGKPLAIAVHNLEIGGADVITKEALEAASEVLADASQRDALATEIPLIPLSEVRARLGSWASMIGEDGRVDVRITEADESEQIPRQAVVAIINLAENALHANPATPVNVSLKRVGTDLEVRIVDDGVGLSPIELTRFTRVGETSRRESGGTGLGLPGAQALISRLGGWLTFQSRPGRGTTVIISFRGRGST